MAVNSSRLHRMRPINKKSLDHIPAATATPALKPLTIEASTTENSSGPIIKLSEMPSNTPLSNMDECFSGLKVGIEMQHSPEIFRAVFRIFSPSQK
jgi:hypothetical protein